MKRVKSLLRAAAMAGALAAAGQAQAITFVLNNTGGAEAGTRARQGFDIAAAYWSSVLRDASTVNLSIGFKGLGAGVIGSTGSAYTLLSMNQGYTALRRDATSALDASAVANLQTLTTDNVTGTFGALAVTANDLNASGDGYTDLATRLDDDGGINNSTLAVTKASAKALGIVTDVNGRAINYGSSDGAITFSSDFGFDFDPTDGIDADKFDFIGVAIHEIGHALGFVSGVDDYDYYTTPGVDAADLEGAGNLEDYVVASQLDLFRYSAAGKLDWSTQNTPYFSINGGASQLFGDSRFATGELNGDGNQASHWKDSARGRRQLGIMDPTADFGQLDEVTALDLAAFDAIGYNLNFDVLANGSYRFTTADAYRSFAANATPVVPEPATWAMMIAGFGMVGASMRRRAAVRQPATSG